MLREPTQGVGHPPPREGGMPVAINTIPILNCDGNPHIWVSGVSKRVLTRLAGV